MNKLKCFLCAALCMLLVGCGGDSEETTASSSEPQAEEKTCIVVDAGHGLGDVGALNEENLGNVTEADINFSVASLLASELKEMGYEVIMSHDGKVKPETEYDDGEDTYGPSERADFSNATDANLFISIHCDSFPQSADVYGTRLYYASGTPYATKLDKKLASAVGKALDSAFPDAKDVILKPMNENTAYTVLYKTKAPSLLIECGFITNKGDADKLLDAEWQAQFAAAIADGIEHYLK